MSVVRRMLIDFPVTAAVILAAMVLCGTTVQSFAETQTTGAPAKPAPGGREYHVATSGDDARDGTAAQPLRTIQAAADRAQPGDVITVHEGVYRERIDPPRGGTSDQRRIVYQAAPGDKVVIKGSEPVTGWEKVGHDTWKVTLPDSFFGDFNPFKDVIRGDWFNPKGRVHHTGAVYLNGHWLTEAAKLDDVLKPAGKNPLWFTQAGPAGNDSDKDDDGAKTTIIWAQFPGVDPNKENVEINARQAVFYPSEPGCDYITVRGFTLEQAATPWAPPTAEQIGLIGTHWSKGWVIENNTIRYSVCTGVTLGKYGDEWDNRAQSAKGYVGTINRALENGWSKENIGHHVVRGNHISHCEQAGIVGSLGPVFSTIVGNEIHDIHVRHLFTGAEMAGIKLHGAIDTLVAFNHIHHTYRGIWLDWMAQGARVLGNRLHDNGRGFDLFLEVNHGPMMIDNNLFLSERNLLDWSQGGAFAHNLFTGRIAPRPERRRETPYHKPHSTEVAGLHNIPGGDHRFYNNIFAGGSGLAPYDKAAFPMQMAGNLFLGGARPAKAETDAAVLPEAAPNVKLVETPEGLVLEITLDKSWLPKNRPLVTTELLGKTRIAGLPFKQPDGTPYRLRKSETPLPGPFAEPWPDGRQTLKVWPPAGPSPE